MTKPDPERIWLQNAEDAKQQCEGRLWCEDKVWPAGDDPEEGEPTEYIRADIHSRALLEAHQRGRREGMEWQPIKTAPKDGRVIIGYWNEEYMETIAFRDGEWIWSHDGDTWLKSGPTHWMPLPDAPAAIRAKINEAKP